jgi:CO/xanthine dehydrogenase Mo-binding subunit
MLPFIDDLAPKNVLHAAVYRAPVAPARIRRLVVPPLPQGYFAVQAKHVPGARVLCCAGYCLPVLADTRVLYRGEALVLLCGAQREELADLLRAVVLECTPEKAGAGVQEEPEPASFSRGDAGAALSAAYQIVEGEYRTPASEHFCPDTQGAVADWSGKSLTVHSSTEDPFAVRRELARLLAIPERRIRILATRVGETMQGKLLPAVLVAAHAALLSVAANRPVKLVLDREQDTLCTPKSPAFVIRHQTALGPDGMPTGARVDIVMSTGPVAPLGSGVLHEAARAAWGAYRLPNLEVAARWAGAEGAPGGSYRAAGAMAAYFAAELHASRLEDIAQMDPYTWKKRWLPEAGRAGTGKRGASPGTAERVRVRSSRASGAQQVLEEVVGASDFRRKHAAFAAHNKRRRNLQAGPLRGVGLAVAGAEPEAEEPGRAPAALRVVLEKGRRLRIYSSLVECSAEVQRILAERAAKILDLEAGRIEFLQADTQLVPDTGPTSLDRALRIVLPLLEHCCHSVHRKSLRATLPVEARRSASRIQPGRSAESRAWAAAVLEVEVDPESLESECHGLWLAVCSGTVVSEELARRTIEGQAMRALTFASRAMAQFEESTRDNGARGCGLMPELPVIQKMDIRLLPGEGPPQGYERLPHLCVPAAYTAAVSQATGLYIDEIPVTPEAIQACLHQG